MKWFGRLAVSLLLVSAAVWIWVQLSAGPEKQIHARLGELQELVSFRASDGNLAALSDLQKLGSLFAIDAQVRVDAPGIPATSLTGRDMIIQAAGAARQAVRDLDIEFDDITVTLGPDGRSAVVDAVGKGRGLTTEGLWVQQLRFRFIDTDEGWLISLVETVRTFSGPAPLRNPLVQGAHGA